MRFQENPIWRKLEIFSIDPPDVQLTFEKRLARENSWSQDFASKVVSEYKKFLFLCVSQDQPCTPSEFVDQAWHLHLVYTKSYWNDLCENVLGKKLHHNPTEGGEAEQEKFHDYYNSTLDLYRQTFQTEPPPDIWPLPNIRFYIPLQSQTGNRFNFKERSTKRGQSFLVIGAAIMFTWLSHNFVFLLIGVLVVLILYAPPGLTSGGSTGGCSSGGCGSNWGGDSGGDSGASGDSGCSSGCSGCGGGCGGD